MISAVLAVARGAAREQLRYPIDLLASGGFLAVVLFLYWRLWTVVESQGGLTDLGRFDVTALVTYLLVTELVVLAPGALHLQVAEDVRSGVYSVSLLRPLPHAAWEMGRALGTMSARLLGLLALGLPFLVFVVGLPELRWRDALLALGFVLPVAILLECAVRVSIGLLAFWVEDVAPVYWIWQKFLFVLGGLFMPIEFYPDWLYSLASWLPFRVLLHDPARMAVGGLAEGELVPLLLRLLFWSAVLFGGLLLLERLGRRHVQAQGG
ncbi:MAG: ABC-2 family transporter protein [Acidobacteriota bacterium]